MNKNKHLLNSGRVLIELHLNNRLSFNAISRELGKDPTTIAKEVKNHIRYKKSGCYGLFTAKNIDMPRVVRMSKRKTKKVYKVDKTCRIGRTYDDFCLFMKAHPDFSIVEMDSVEGSRGGKVLLTLHFTVPQLMLAFIRDANTSQSVIDIINQLYLELRPDIFCDLFKVSLADNGSEFSNPKVIEFDLQGNRRTHVFYCNPSAAYQKGAIENNHEFIRRNIPKGQSLDGYTQEDINLMMNHINSYRRKNLGDKSPYEIFSLLYGEDILRRMGATIIPDDEITLRPSLLIK